MELENLEAHLSPTEILDTPTASSALQPHDSVPITQETREDKIMGGSKPIFTLLKLSIGPLFFQITNSMYGFVNTLCLGKWVSQKATTALATTTTIDSLANSFGFFLSTCASSRIAALFGDHKEHLTSQVLSDLIRICVILGILIPSVLLPVSKPLMRWFGAQEDIVSLGFQYLVPQMSCSCLTCLYLLLCGCLQAEGRIFIFSLLQFISMCLNAGCFNPLFLLGFKIGIKGSSISIIISQSLPAICILIPYYLGKFTVKPKPRELLNKFSPETFHALKIGLPSLICAVSATLPSIFFQKFIGASAGPKDFNTMMSLYNAYNRVYQVVIALFLAITLGYLPSASWAYAANLKKRVLVLFGHCIWIISVISFTVLILLNTTPNSVGKIFNSDPFFLKMFQKCVLPYWTTIPIASWLYAFTVLLQASDHPRIAIILSFITQLCFWPAYAFLFYYTNKHDVVRLFYAVMASDLSSFVLMLPFTIWIIWKLYKESKFDKIIPIPDSHSSNSADMEQQTELKSSSAEFHEETEQVDEL